MLKVIKELLLEIIKNIDCGNSSLSEGEAVEVVNLLKKYTMKDIGLSKYQTYPFLGISGASFDNLVENGSIPKDKKAIGFKELRWYKKDLQNYIKKIQNV